MRSMMSCSVGFVLNLKRTDVFNIVRVSQLYGRSVVVGEISSHSIDFSAILRYCRN